MLKRNLRIIITLVFAAAMVFTVADYTYAKKKATKTTKTTSKKQPSKSERTSATVKNEKQKTEKEIKETKQKLTENQKRTRQQLDELNNINSQIQRQESTIADLNALIANLDTQSRAVTDTITEIENNITILSADVAGSMRQARVRRFAINPITFVFASSTYAEAQRRLNYIRQLEHARNVKVDQLAAERHKLDTRRAQLDSISQRNTAALNQLSTANSILSARKNESARVVADLKRQGADLNKILAEKQRKARQLDAELDRIIAHEQELARREQERKNNRKTEQGKTKPNQGSKPNTQQTGTADPDRTLTGSFASNKGRLLFPVAGRYTIVGTFGRSQHGDLDHVQVDNSGIDIAVSPGTKARAVFEGTVSSIFFMDGYENIVMIRHGSYVTVYAGLSNITVAKGTKVTTGQNIGTVATIDGRTVLHFEVRKEREKLNPLSWVK